MEILFLDFFRDSIVDSGNKYNNLSEYCNRIDNEIKLYCRNDIYSYYDYGVFGTTDVSLTFPNVIYIDRLFLAPEYCTKYMFPDLKEVGSLSIGRGFDKLDYLWGIDTIDFFLDMNYLLHPMDNSNPKLRCNPIGDKMYRFTSDKGSWDIRVNRYN